MYIIYDCVNNKVLEEKFKTFDDAEEYLSIAIEEGGGDYDEDRGEFEIEEV